MELKAYSTEELKVELKRRSDLAKAEKVKVKKSKITYYEITCYGYPNNKFLFGLSGYGK